MSLEAKNLWKQLDYKEVIRGVELTVSPGEVVGVFGEPGSGKSTLMRLLSGLLTLTAGKSEFLGITLIPEIVMKFMPGWEFTCKSMRPMKG